MNTSIPLPQLITRVNGISENLSALKSNITDAYNSSKIIDDNNKIIKTTTTEYKTKSSMYDRLFQEKESNLQKNGGRNRHETLQEYCLLTFYVAYCIFIISLTVYSATLYGIGAAAKIFVTGLCILLPITGIVVLYG